MIDSAVILLLVKLIHLHGPGNKEIAISEDKIVSLRAPQEGDHFAKGVRCIVTMEDGKFATVLEDCRSILHLLETPK